MGSSKLNTNLYLFLIALSLFLIGLFFLSDFDKVQKVIFILIWVWNCIVFTVMLISSTIIKFLEVYIDELKFLIKNKEKYGKQI